MILKIIIEKGNDGYIVAHCPSLKSCWTQAKTQEEVLINIREAIELFLDPELTNFIEDEYHKIYEMTL